MKVTIDKLPEYRKDDMRETIYIVSHRIPNTNDLHFYYSRRKFNYTYLLCKCNICKRLIGKYIVDDFGIPIKATFEDLEHSCRKSIKKRPN